MLTFLQILALLLDILQWIVFVWVLLSWIVFFLHSSKFRWRYRGVYQALERLSGFLDRAIRPLLRPFRRLLRNVNTGRIDWSPMLLILAIMLVRRVVIGEATRLILLR